ncbi:MAG: hypothetical protein CME60_10955 [Halobacteriovoraceae bacterium]|nr:hypothetical protein [Halobacteriovoraceae bacterium]
MRKLFFKNYFFYFITIILRIAVWYYIARIYDNDAFVEYNQYVFNIDIILSIVGSGTVAFFAVDKNRGVESLRYVMLCELILYVFVFFGMALFYSLVVGRSNLSFFILFSLSSLKVGNQVFTRYKLFNESLHSSLVNDLVGNYLWCIVVLVSSYFTKFENLRTFILIWIAFLVVNNFWNIVKYSSLIFKPISIQKFKSFYWVYFRTLQFSLSNKLYPSLEKLVFAAKFLSPELVASYYMISKVIGLGVELTGSFFNQFLNNNLDKLRADSKLDMLEKLAGLQLILSLLMFGGIFIFKSLIIEFAGVQMSPKFFNLFYVLLPLLVLSSLHKLFTVGFYRKQNYALLNTVGVLQLFLLLVIYFINLGVWAYFVFQALFFLIVVLVDVLGWRLRKGRGGLYANLHD